MLKFGGSSCLSWDQKWSVLSREVGGFTFTESRWFTIVRLTAFDTQLDTPRKAWKANYKRQDAWQPPLRKLLSSTRLFWFAILAEPTHVGNGQSPATTSADIRRCVAQAVLSGFRWHSDKHAPRKFPEAQCAFKIWMIHEMLQFALRIAFRCVLHRCGNLDIHCWKLYIVRF